MKKFEINSIEQANELFDSMLVGKAFGIFGRDPESGYMLIDDGCAGNWDGREMFLKNINKASRGSYGKLTLYYGCKYSEYEDMEEAELLINF